MSEDRIEGKTVGEIREGAGWIAFHYPPEIIASMLSELARRVLAQDAPSVAHATENSSHSG